MAGTEVKAPEEVDNYLLATVMMWMDKTTVSNTERLMEQYFKYDQVHEAQEILCEKMQKKKPTDKRPTNLQRLQKSASELVTLIQELQAQGETKQVKVVVTPTNLARVPLMESTWGVGDVSTAARLLNLERQMTEMRVEMARVASTPAPASTYKDIVAKKAPEPVVPKAKVVGKAKVKAVPKAVPAEPTSSEGGELEGEEPFQVVARKKGKKAPRKVQYGTGQVTAGGASGEAAPYEVWIGNTHPASTPDIIKEVLVECGRRMEGDGLQEELSILEVECLTKPRDDGKAPHTKQWRVKVPNRFREHMKQPGAYQVGWSSRRFFPARSSRPKVAELTMGPRRGSTVSEAGSTAGINGQ
jgi:hypothetical protein